MACDLADLNSTDSFVTKWKQVGGAIFDVVCYNAGIARNTEAKDWLGLNRGLS